MRARARRERGHRVGVAAPIVGVRLAARCARLLALHTLHCPYSRDPSAPLHAALSAAAAHTKKKGGDEKQSPQTCSDRLQSHAEALIMHHSDP